VGSPQQLSAQAFLLGGVAGGGRDDLPLAMMLVRQASPFPTGFLQWAGYSEPG